MALWLFLDNTAIVSRDTVTNDNGIERKTKSTIYSSIKCHIYQLRGSNEDTELAVNTKMNTWRCITEPQVTGIRQGDYLSVSDPALWDIGDYQVIDQPKANRLINGSIDSIQFTIKQI